MQVMDCDEVLVLDRGRLVEQGPPKELLRIDAENTRAHAATANANAHADHATTTTAPAAGAGGALRRGYFARMVEQEGLSSLQGGGSGGDDRRKEGEGAVNK